MIDFVVICIALVQFAVASSKNCDLFPKFDNSKLDSLSEFKACPLLKPKPYPTNVRDLRIDDIGVVLALGDSITAGLNSEFAFGDYSETNPCPKAPVQLEFRGSSYATGADDGIFSIGNAIKHYNPNVIGLSKGQTSMEICYGIYCPVGTKWRPFNSTVNGLNAAESGAWANSQDLTNQFSYLSLFYKTFVPPPANPWKLAIITIGFNNACLACISSLQTLFFTADQYEYNLLQTMERLRLEYGKMVVLLQTPFQFNTLRGIMYENPICKALHDSPKGKRGCRCVTTDEGVAKMDLLIQEYAARAAKVSNEYRAKNYDDFAVVNDAGLFNTNIVNVTAPEILSGMDCLHPNIHSHQRMAVSMWNNIFKPAGEKKPFEIRDSQKVECATDDSRIWV